MKLIAKLIFLCLLSLRISAQHTTFFVDGNQLKDPCGNPIRLIGINKMSIFTDREGKAIEQIAQTGANCVRIVWGSKYPDATGNFILGDTKISELENLVKKCIASKMICIIDAHDAVGAWSFRENVMRLWERPDVIDLIKKYEGWIIINIGNEIGGHHDNIDDNPANEAEFISWYSKVSVRLRSKGIKVPFMIDSPNDGKDMEYIVRVANSLLAVDANLIFSVHTYWSNFDINKENLTPTQFITAQFNAASSLPMIIGELSKYGGDGDDSNKKCASTNEVSYDIIAKECLKRNFGYIAWEWGPGNAGGGDPLCEKMDMTNDNNFTGLKNGEWGQDLVNNPNYGIKVNAKKTPYFDKDCLCENVKLEITTGNRRNVLDWVYSWSSTSTNIQSYVLEVETFGSFHRPSVKKSLPFPSNRSQPLLNAYQFHVGAASAKLKVFRKDGNECYVSLR